MKHRILPSIASRFFDRAVVRRPCRDGIRKAQRALGAADRLAVQALMLRPEVLFRSELGVGKADCFADAT